MHGYIRFSLKMNIKFVWAAYIRDVLKQCATEYKSFTWLNSRQKNIKHHFFDYTIDCAKTILGIKTMIFFWFSI